MKISPPASNRTGIKNGRMKLKYRELDLQEKDVNGMDKIKRYGWKMRNSPGEFHWIPKADLSIDHTYQRNKLNVKRIEDMARNWDWIACGALVVSLREDNAWFVMDGQNRKLAADKRSDIKELPCLVFEADGVRDEALGFLAINTGKVGVSGLDRFKAMVRAGDKAAVGLRDVLATTGHKAGSSSSSKTVACVITLLRLYKVNPTRFASGIWPLLADMHPGKPIVDATAKGVFQVDTWLRKENRNVADSPYREKLMALGGDAAAALIRQETVLMR
jgi:hypothetical protein